MKKLIILVTIAFSTFFMIPCAFAQSPIVGVWELAELQLGKSSQPPPVEITNKKDIYTQDGHYHNTAPDSTEMTDVELRSYEVKDGVVTIYRSNGAKQLEGKIVFRSPNFMEITDKKGTVIGFKKISDDPQVIPRVEENKIRVKYTE
ncbi:MAG: hypothetical protein A2X82_13925 [Geobacteraceae bacterium GWC2_55_20]|nr:MAG: hypothetical protein A2X82_13925 [Geobacteraceae bacterium GWC2_55_20]OGU19212.1 MAG: hypothetical protein A2X85_02550 [Geobacteraceae bacterium GWF2_54_21]HBA72625.1 hypothetical protein [Geobacter sp.]HCE66661.1 hypothetical protein [Geobacter sp.]